MGVRQSLPSRRPDASKGNLDVPRFLPFRGLRYTNDDLAAVAAPPYDVIDDDERAVLAARHVRNAVQLILPDGPVDTRYDAAAALLADWQADGFLATDPEPRFYGYRMRFRDDAGRPRTTDGVLGTLSLPDAAGTGDVLPHEQTLPKAKSDRLALLRATRANLDPIWALSPAAGLDRLAAGGTPLVTCTDSDGVEHSLSAIDDPAAIAAIEAAVASGPVVLADGHHRFETAITYRDEQRGAGRAQPGDESVLCLIVELADDQLFVQPIHRLLSGLPDGFDLRGALAEHFTLVDAGPNAPDGVEALPTRMRTEGGLGLADAAGLALLVPHDADPNQSDAARFEAAVTPALPSMAEVTYRDDAATCASLVEKGAANAAILLRPVTVAQIDAAAEARVRMPQKTTFFAPKPRTGMVFRSLDM
jgi:uncharacterized protein (DUF1015 family)